MVIHITTLRITIGIMIGGGILIIIHHTIIILTILTTHIILIIHRILHITHHILEVVSVQVDLDLMVVDYMLQTITTDLLQQVLHQTEEEVIILL